MKTNAVSSKFNYSEKSKTKSLGSKKGHGNPSEGHASRGASKAPGQRSSSSKKMDGLSVGQKVPMAMFDQKYQKPDMSSMTQVVDANKIKRGAKKALAGKQKSFFGL